MSKLPDEVTNRSTRTGLGTLVSISSPGSLENRSPVFDVTIGGMVLMDGKLCGLTTAHGLGNMPTSDTHWEREPCAEGEDIYNIPPPAMLIVASSNSTDATPEDRQAWGGGGVCRGDWALVEVPEDQILPNILSSHDDDPDYVLSSWPDDVLSDWENALWATGHSSAPERQQHTLFPSSKAPRTTSSVPCQKGGSRRIVDTIFARSLVREHPTMGFIDALPCVVETARGLSRANFFSHLNATLTVEGKSFQVLRVLLDRPVRKMRTSIALSRH